MSHTENTAPKKENKILKNKWVQASAAIVAAVLIAGGLLYWQNVTTRVGIDTSQVLAPVIALSPSAPGTLNAVYVNVGDTVTANTVVAKVGNENIKTKVAGQVVSIDNEVGKTFNPGQAVVNLVDPSALRVVGTIDENKGFDKLRVGQLATFTVDAFGSQKFEGVIDEISPTANTSDVVFNISDARETQQFNIKVRFDPTKYPQIKNGMSAKLTIFIK